MRTRIAERIAKLYRELDCEAIVEIGPGKGSITKKIVDLSPNLILIEKDETMREHLTPLSARDIIFGDVLETDIAAELIKRGLNPVKTLVVGNLPYYITSPIMRQCFGAQGLYAGGLVMMQDEVGARLFKDADKKGFVRRIINRSYDVMYAKKVGRKSFSPPPKVMSCLLELRKKDSPSLDGTTDTYNRMMELLEHLLGFARKTIGKIGKMQTKKGHPIVIPESLAGKRMEDLTWGDMSVLLSAQPVTK